MRSTRHISMVLAATMLAAGSLPSLAECEARQPIKPTPKSGERLTKAQKKRERKAAQRARLAELGKSEVQK